MIEPLPLGDRVVEQDEFAPLMFQHMIVFNSDKIAGPPVKPTQKLVMVAAD